METAGASSNGDTTVADQAVLLESAQSGGVASAPSPLTGCYLLIVIGEPHSQEHKDIILQRMAKGFLSWDKDDCHVDLEKELQILTTQAPEGEEAKYGERLIQYASENLVTEVLIHPAFSTLAQCMRNLLSSFTRHRHIIHAGYTFAGNGSWILQDGTFSHADFCDSFQEHEVQRVIRAYENSVTVDIHCSPEGEWPRLPKESFTKHCKVRINPTDVLTSGSPAITAFVDYIAPFLNPVSLDTLLESSDVVGNIRFSHPTLYVFPGGQGDAALFGINGFNMLVDGGFNRKACFWDFTRHLDRLDAVLVTRINNSNISGISAVLQRKRHAQVYPQIGHFFCNIQERKTVLSPDGDKDKDPLLISLIDEGHDLVSNLRALNLRPQGCYRDSDPINLYHKVGHGTLDMYVLNPAKDTKEVKEFLQKWYQNDQKLFTTKKDYGDCQFPVQNLVSICVLLVWQPANPDDTITRILFPGSAPQYKIFEGLDKLKHLEFMKRPTCTAKTLSPAGSTIGLKTKQNKTVLEKILPEQKKIQPTIDNKQQMKDTSPQTNENKQKIENKKITENRVRKAQPRSATIKSLKSDDMKSESFESEKDDSKGDDIKKIESNQVAEKNELNKPKSEHRSKIDTIKSTAKSRPDTKHGKSVDRKTARNLAEKKASADVKSSPTTPKKTLESKVNGTIKEKEITKMRSNKLSNKQSPSSTPAKSTKDANNRKVIESKYKTPSLKKEPMKTTEKKDVTKPERKPISHRPKGTSPSRRPPGSPAKSAKSTPSASIKSEKDAVIRKIKLDKEGTTDSSTVSTPSADQDTILKKIEEGKLTKEEIEALKAQELADLKEEQEVVKEIEAVFNKDEKKELKAELEDVETRKIADSTETEAEATEPEETEEYIIIEKEEIEQVTEDSAKEQESTAKEEDEIQKHMRDSEDSEKRKKEIAEIEEGRTELQKEPIEENEKEPTPEEEPKEKEVKLADSQELVEEKDKDAQEKQKVDESITPEHKDQIQNEVQDIIKSATEIIKSKDDIKEKTEEMSKDVSTTSPEDKVDVSSEKKTTDTKDNEDVDVKEPGEPGVYAAESQPDEKLSTTFESGATTAPTLPEDERITLDDIKEDNVDQGIEEKHVKEETKEKEIPISIEPTKFEPTQPIPTAVSGIQFDAHAAHQTHLRDIVKTPDEVADLPVHEEADMDMYDDFPGYKKDVTKKTEEGQEDVKEKTKTPEHKVDEAIEKEKVEDEVLADKEKKLDGKLVAEKAVKDEKVTEEHIVKEHDVSAEKIVDKEEVPKKEKICVVEEKVITEEQKDEVLEEIVKDQPKESEITDVKHEKDETILAAIEDSEEKNKTSPKKPSSRKESLKMEIKDHESVSRKESLVTEEKSPAIGKDTVVEDENQESAEQKSIVEEKAPESRKESLKTEVKESLSRKESLITDEKISETRKQSITCEEKESKSRKESLVTAEKESESGKESLEEKESASRKESLVTEEKKSELKQEKEENGSRKQSLKIEDEKPSSRKSSVAEEKEEVQLKEKIKPEEKESESRKSSLIQQEIESSPKKYSAENIEESISPIPDEFSEKQEFIKEKESIKQTEINEKLEQSRKESLKLEEELKEGESKPEVSISRKESLVCEEKEQPSPKEPSSRKDSLVTDKVIELNARKESLKADSEEKEIEKPTSRRESLKLDLDKEGSKETGSRKQSLKLDIGDETSKEVESDLKTGKESVDIDEDENEAIKDKTKGETYSRAQTIELKESYIGVQPTSDETKDNIIDEKTDEQISAICDIKVEEDLVVKHTLHKPDHAEIVTVTPDMTPDSPRFITKTTTDEAKESQSDEKCVALEFETPYTEYGYVTTELRETHITTVESPIRDDLGKSFGHESPKATMRSFLDEERKLSSLHLTDKIDEEQDEEEEQAMPQEKKITSLLEESKALMDSTSKIISGIKSSSVSSVSETKSTGDESENQQTKSETDKETERDDKKQEDTESSFGRTVDVLKIVASVADVLKSDKPLHEFDDIEWQDLKAPIQVSSTTEVNKDDDKISEKNTIETPQDIESDIKKELKKDIETEAPSHETSDKGTVKRMLVTASSEDGGLETEICPTGSIIFSQSSREGSGKTSPDIKEDISSSDGHDKLGDISNDVTPEPTVLSEKDSSGKSSPGIKDTSGTSTPDVQQEKEKEAVGSEISSRKSSMDVQDKTASSKLLENVKDETSGKGTPDITDADDITSGKSSPDLISRISRTSISEVHDEKVAVKDISRTSTPESKKEASGTATPDIKSTSEKTVEDKKIFEKDVSGKTSPAPSEPRLSAVSASDIAAVSTPKDISRTSTPEVQLKEPLESGKASPAPEKISSGKTSPMPEKSESGKGSSTVEESDSEKNTETTGTKTDSLEKDLSEKDESKPISITPEKIDREFGKTSPTPEHKDSRKSSLIQEKIESGKASPAPSDKIESGKESPGPEKEESRKTSLIAEKRESGNVSPAPSEKIESGHTSPTPEKIESGKVSPAPEKGESRKTSLVSEKSGSGKESPAQSDKLESGKTTPAPEKMESGKASPAPEKEDSRKTSLTSEKTDSGKISPVPSDKIESGTASPVPEKIESGKASPAPAKDESRKTSLISEKSGSGKESPAPSDKLESGKTTPASEKIGSGKASPAPEKEDSRKTSLTHEKVESGKASPAPSDKIESGKASPLPEKEESRKTSLISEKSGSGKTSPALSEKIESGKASPIPEETETGKTSNALETEDLRKSSLKTENVESGKTSPAPFDRTESGKTSPAPEKIDSGKISLTLEKDESITTSLIEKIESGKSSPEKIESGKVSPIHEKTDSKEIEKCSPEPEKLKSEKTSPQHEKTDTNKLSSSEINLKDISRTSTPVQKLVDSKESSRTGTPDIKPTEITEKLISSETSGKSTPNILKSGKSSPGLESIEKLDELTTSKADSDDLPTKEELIGKSESSEKDVDTMEKSTKVDKTDSSKSEKTDSEKSDGLKKATIQEISQNGINGVLEIDNGIDFIEENSKESVTVSEVEKATSKLEPSEKSEIITTTSTTVTTIVTDKDGKQTTTVTKETTDSDGTHTTVTQETSEDVDKKTEETKNDTEVPEISIDGKKIDSHISPTHMYEVTTAKYTTGSPDLQANGQTSPDLRPGSQTSGRSTPEIKIDLDVDLNDKEMKLIEDEDDISVEPTDLDKPGPSTAKDITKHSSEDLHLSGKSTPDIAEVEKIKEMHEILKHEKHIPGRSTPPTVPVSPNIIKDKEDVFTMQTDDEKSLMTQSMYIASDQTEKVEHTIVESSDSPGKLSTVTTVTTTIITDKDGKQTTTVTKETTDDSDKQSTTTVTETKGVHDGEDKQPATSSLEEAVSKTDDAKEIFKQSSKESVTDDDKIIHAATAILNGTGASTETVTKKTTSSEILRSSTPGSDDYDAGGVSSPPSDMSSGQMSRIPHHWGSDERQGYSDEEDVPSSPLSVTSHVAASPTSGNFNYEDIAGTGMTESFYPQKAMDTMSTSFYGSFPDEPIEELKSTVTTVTTKTVTEYGSDSDKTTTVTKEEVTNEGGATKTTTTTTTVTKSPKHGEEASASGKEVKADPIESWGKPLGLPHPTDPRRNIMETSYYGEFSEESDDFDPIAKWGKPLGLPSPAPPTSNDTVKTTPKKERKTTTSMLAAKNRMNDEKRRSESPGKFGKKINPVYMDLTYVPHHGNANYSYVDFFKRIRARYYVFSGIEPSKEVYNALLEAKMSWEDKDLEVTIIPTYDTDVLCYWVSENEEQLAKWKIDLSPSASRCTINLQDHETSCSAYRLEF